MPIPEDTRRGGWWLFYTAVNKGFLQSCNARSNQILRAEQGRFPVDHYRIPLATNPNGTNATRFGSRGLIRESEANVLYDYYESLNRNDVESALGYVGSEGEPLIVWDRSSGWLAEPTKLTYPVWLESRTPKLYLIDDPNPAPTLELAAVASIATKSLANANVRRLTGATCGECFTMALSPTGDPPATHWAAHQRFPDVHLWAVAEVFPVNGADPDVIVLDEGRMIWNNDVGTIPRPRPYSLDALVRDENLKFVR